MGERVKVGEWWEIHQSDGLILASHSVRKHAVQSFRSWRKSTTCALIHVTRYRGKRPTCDACGAEIGACPSDCESDGAGHGFHPADITNADESEPDVALCHGCGAYETPSLEELMQRVHRRRRKTPAAAGEEVSGG